MSFMWVRRAAVAVALGTIGLAAKAATILDIVNQVSQTSYQNYLDNSLYTHTGDSRYAADQHDAAQSNIFSTFAGLNLVTSLSNCGTSCNNVIGVLPGAVDPNSYYVVGAHYDSVAGAPGADDDGSGVAAVLEAARVLSQYSFADSIVFVAFDREEQGLIGSGALAASWPAQFGGTVLGMVQLDMIAYNPGSADAALLYTLSGGTNGVSDGLGSALTLYSGLTGAFGGAIGLSDHASFANQGYAAALLIEAFWSSNPNYHRATDSVNTAEYIDYGYATGMTRAAVGYLATEAEVVPEPATWLVGGWGCAVVVIVGVWRRGRSGRGEREEPGNERACGLARIDVVRARSSGG